MARGPRSDAARNRDRILATAVEVFTAEGLGASLDSIAKAAGVGSATLYRNFPSREALIVATYEREVDLLAADAAELLATLAPMDALREWLWRYVEYVATKRGMAEVLRHVASGEDAFFIPTRMRLLEAMGALLRAGVEAGQFRNDVDARHLFRVATAVCLSSDDPDWKEHSRTVLAVFLDGLAFRPLHPAG